MESTGSIRYIFKSRKLKKTGKRGSKTSGFCRFYYVNGKVKTLPVAVQAFVGSYVKQWDLILTAALLAMIPMIIVFLLAQKQIMNGMVEGAIK